KHPIFHKYVRKHVKYKVHDEKNECKAGDTVLIIESRPMSRDKRWRMIEILEKAK
ncbi:MAG: 30S ribosomal protein S17, partial [Smithellaceae bacterium]